MTVQNLKMRRGLIALLIVSLVVVALAGGGLWYAMTQAAPTLSPIPVFTPPPSFDDLAAQYPDLAKYLQDPAFGTTYKEFLIAYQQGGLAAAEQLARDQGLVTKQDELRVTLILDSATNLPAVSAELAALGVIVESSYADELNIAIPFTLIERVAQTQNPGAVLGQIRGLAHVIKLRVPQPNSVQQSGATSQAVTPTGALAWHQAGFTGRGVKVGILDLGFDGYKNLLGKTLPSTERVHARSFVRGVEPDAAGEIHGAACAEIIHAMAPDAELYLAYSTDSSEDSQAIQWFIEQGVKIVSHSAGSFIGPMDGTGAYAKLIDDQAAKGILWINSSGNSADEHYRFSSSQLPSGVLTLHYQALLPNAKIVLEWDDWAGNAASQDYDLYLYDASGKILQRSEERQAGQPKDVPVEGFKTNLRAGQTAFLEIRAKHATRQVTFDLFTYYGEIEDWTPAPEHSITTPADARGSFTIGAIQWNKNQIEGFSSQGPTTDGRIKPDLVGPDGVLTASYSPKMFSGTSASAPHVAGAAALVWGRTPSLTSVQVQDYLETNAVDLGVKGKDNVYGSGNLNLPSPAQPLLPTVPPTLPPTILAQPQPPTSPPTAPPTAPAIPQPTRAPTVVPPPTAKQDSNALIGTIALLGSLLCFGAIGSIAGLTLLIVTTRVRPSPPTPMPL